jgi:hypothetical protein
MTGYEVATFHQDQEDALKIQFEKPIEERYDNFIVFNTKK